MDETILDQIRKTIFSSRIAREPISDNKLIIEEYYAEFYADIVKNLGIPNLPLIVCNSINKRICLAETQNQYCLVFDNYIIELFYLLNQFDSMDDYHIETICLKIMAESCRLKSWYISATYFAGEYIDRFESVIKWFEKKSTNEFTSYLFVQQDFMIAHELIHYVVRNKPTFYARSIESIKGYFSNIVSFALNHFNDVATNLLPLSSDKLFIEECFCDISALIHATDIGSKLKNFSLPECATACALALLNQFQISIVSEAIYSKYSENQVDLLTKLNRFNARLLCFKKAAFDYLCSNTTREQASNFLKNIDEITVNWNKKVQVPTLNLVSKKVLQAQWEEEVPLSRTEKEKLNKSLKMVFNT
jgi:hypothetical protein